MSMPHLGKNKTGGQSPKHKGNMASSLFLGDPGAESRHCPKDGSVGQTAMGFVDVDLKMCVRKSATA
jgi:hypothetical protein